MEAGSRSECVAGCRPVDCPIQLACDGDGAPACAQVKRTHGRILQLCDVLEEIADALPGRVDSGQCRIVGEMLMPLLRYGHDYEEQHFFPAYEMGEAEPGSRVQTIRRLKSEHMADEGAAQDVADALTALGDGAPVTNAEALGFMLRAFFETQRRHVAFEQEHLLPLVVRRAI